jgi:hypothetical protein
MKTEMLKLQQVKVNERNPRTITERKFNLLIESILVFPAMLEIRPVVVDDKNTALGGNMRLLALRKIAEKDIREIEGMLSSNKEFLKKTQAERSNLLDYWGNWLQQPTVHTAKASKLSKEERDHFIIADNASFGQWDYDDLANNWDNAEIQSWGVDVWLPEQSLAQPQAQPVEPSHPTYADPEDFDRRNLPIELVGADLNPDNLPKIEGDDQTAVERIIIVYPKERKQELCALLGIQDINKIIYNISEFNTAQ